MIRNSPPKRKRFYDKVWAKASRDLSKPPKPPKPIGSSSDSGSDEEPEIIPLRDRVGEYEAEEIELTEVEALNEEDDQYRWKVQLTSLQKRTKLQRYISDRSEDSDTESKRTVLFWC